VLDWGTAKPAKCFRCQICIISRDPRCFDPRCCICMTWLNFTHRTTGSSSRVMTCMVEVLGSNLSRYIGYPGPFCGFSRPAPVNVVYCYKCYSDGLHRYYYIICNSLFTNHPNIQFIRLQPPTASFNVHTTGKEI